MPFRKEKRGSTTGWTRLNAWTLMAVHYIYVVMSTMASQITSLTIVYSTIYSGADHRNHQSFALLAFVRGIHRWPVNSPHKGPVTRKMLPFDDVIMIWVFIANGIVQERCRYLRSITLPRELKSFQFRFEWCNQGSIARIAGGRQVLYDPWLFASTVLQLYECTWCFKGNNSIFISRKLLETEIVRW